jgi:hypothetical protein
MDQQRFLESFFGEGNSLRWAKYVGCQPDDPIRVALEPWVNRFQRGQSPYCLPRVESNPERTTWYVLCTDPREARSVREALLAFIGKTYANFNGEFATLCSTDAVDRVCFNHFGPLVFRLPISETKDRAKVHALLSTMNSLRDRESSRAKNAVKPIGRLLRDLEMAIIARNEESANHVYAEIRSRGRLSATNLAFLRVRILSAFERWAETIQLPNFDDIIRVRRPKRISEQLAKAAYNYHFSGFEITGNASAAIREFGLHGQRYVSLVRSTDGLRSTEVIKLALLAAATANPPNRVLAEELIARVDSESDRTWFRSIISQLASEPADKIAESIGGYELAEIRYDAGQFDDAFELYRQQTPTVRSLGRVLESAVEIDSFPVAMKAIAYFQSASDDLQLQVLARKSLVSHLDRLNAIVGSGGRDMSKAVESLAEWFERVDGNNSDTNLVQILEYGLPEWLASNLVDLNKTAEQLKRSRTSSAKETIRNSVPVFIQYFLVDQGASRSNKAIYLALLDLLIYDDSIGADDLTAVEQLIEAILTTSPSQDVGSNDYTFAADVVCHLWESVAAPRYIDWVLSTLDLLIDCGVQQHTSLTPVVVNIINSVRQWTRRVSDEQWNLFGLLAADLGVSDLLKEVRPEDESIPTDDLKSIRDVLRGKTIAVYSLTERIARRFGQLAEQAFDGIKIHYLHDKALSDRMKSLAQSADIFIINTWDAKHAATNGIKQSRAEKLTIEPLGKSASSLLRCLVESLEATSTRP